MFSFSFSFSFSFADVSALAILHVFVVDSFRAVAIVNHDTLCNIIFVYFYGGSCYG